MEEKIRNVVEKAGEFFGKLVKSGEGLEGLQGGFQKFLRKVLLTLCKGFARVYDVENVRRVERQPESECCIFEFW